MGVCPAGNSAISKYLLCNLFIYRPNCEGGNNPSDVYRELSLDLGLKTNDTGTKTSSISWWTTWSINSSYIYTRSQGSPLHTRSHLWMLSTDWWMEMWDRHNCCLFLRPSSHEKWWQGWCEVCMRLFIASELVCIFHTSLVVILTHRAASSGEAESRCSGR